MVFFSLNIFSKHKGEGETETEFTENVFMALF